MTISADNQTTERDAALELWTFMYAHGLDFIPVFRVEDAAGPQSPEVSELISKLPTDLVVGFDKHVHRHHLAEYLRQEGW
ncbi:hypothetical protein SEA_MINECRAFTSTEVE_85 [Gordonia phage MinecraftSteve]|uniref:Uncharacterized protein n=1 Tax=Gordonia phage Waits TaxID=2108120 RepID=A0A2P1JSL2_9CAUD|nr:hypothetical protein FDJ48_gp026 [Gordonia phage Waits]AVO22111.1 hypothetical protein PBI_WAITS_84 [Gordonia phage Waits]QFP95149.1 hypothetical protein SEA_MINECRAFTSTEVE_85 [Gordonia phage MinecraftSteve]QWS67865.1 hypothetical protein SEA_DEKHOCKEY33_86 [Gordonia phage DekHockey33]WIC40177.1 hypothetical protein SEA_BATTLESHIP_87 [Gordonia phage Battleship]